MDNPAENPISPREPIASEETRNWVRDAVAAAKGDKEALSTTVGEVRQFDYYDAEVYLPILSEYIRVLRDSSNNNLEFTKNLLGLSAVLFVAGYKEGQSKEKGAQAIRNIVNQ